MKVGVIIQARTNSSRLPKKVLLPLPWGSDTTVLQQVIRRVRRAKSISKIIVATTKDKKDEQIEKIARLEKAACFCGSEKNVLKRYYQAAKTFGLEIVVRVTGDCPCVCPELIDLIVASHVATGADYSSNTLKRSFPRGLDVEVISFNALEKVYQKANQEFEKEHVTPFVYRHSRQFKINSILATKELTAPQIRVTLDTEEDYTLLCLIYDYLYRTNHYFGADDLVNLFKLKPWIGKINQKVIQKKAFLNRHEEINELLIFARLQGLKKAEEYLKNHL